MIIETTHFGEIEIKDEDILHFDDGILGFSDIHRFGFIRNDDPQSPFSWIQAMERPELAFALVDPFAIKKDYNFELKDGDASSLGIENPTQTSVFAVVVVPEDTKKISMNLKAPIVVNTSNNKAAQVILDSDEYTVRHFILDELQKQGV